MSTTPIITEKITEHARTLGIDEGKVNTYQVSLKWALENGTLVDVNVLGVGLFNKPATLAELGIPADDVRGKRLKPGHRELIVSHPTAHYIHIEDNAVYLGFSPALPPPPSFYFRKSNRIAAMSILTYGEWQTLSVFEPNEATPRWLALPYDPQIVAGWQPESFQGEAAYWLKLDVAPGKSPVVEDDLLCNPANALRSIESRARASVDMNKGGWGQKFAGFGGFAWIGFKAWQTWLDAWTRLESELTAVKAYILWRYDTYRAESVVEFEAMADEAWEAMAARHPGQFAYAAPGRDPLDMPEAFREYIVEKALARLPDRDAIRQRVKIDFSVSLALGQEEVAADELAAEKLQAKIKKAQARLKTTVEQEQAKQSAAWAASEAEKRQIWEQAELVSVQKHAMKLAALEKARQQMAEMVSPYQAMLENLRARMHNDAREIAGSLKTHGGLRGNVAERARNLVEYYRIMSSHDDAEMTALIERLNRQVPDAGGTAKTAPQNSEIEATLNEIIVLTEAAAQNVKGREADTYGFGNLEL